MYRLLDVEVVRLIILEQWCDGFLFRFFLLFINLLKLVNETLVVYVLKNRFSSEIDQECHNVSKVFLKLDS